MTTIAKLDKIVLTRGEGPSEQCDVPFTCYTWGQANEVLRWWAETAPKDFGYDKCYAKITWEGIPEEHSLRVDLHHITLPQETPSGRLDLAERALAYFCRFRKLATTQDKDLDYINGFVSSRDWGGCALANEFRF